MCTFGLLDSRLLLRFNCKERWVDCPKIPLLYHEYKGKHKMNNNKEKHKMINNKRKHKMSNTKGKHKISNKNEIIK